MAEKYLFFNSTTDDRRKHKASDIAEYWASFLSSGLFYLEDGSLPLKVTADGVSNNIAIASGKAVINGHLYINDSLLQKEIEFSPPNENRVDRVVLRLDLNIENRFIKIFVKQGTELAPPELERSGNVYELSLAQVTMRSGTTIIEQSDIVDERHDSELCGVATDGYTSAKASGRNVILDDVNSVFGNKDAESALQLLGTPSDIYKSEIDDNGIFKKITWKQNDTTIKTSTLSNADVDDNYLTRTVEFYAGNGIDVMSTKVFTRSFDDEGNLISEVLS